MPEVCPKSGLPCPVDKKFEAIEANYEHYPGLMELLSRVRDAVEVRRATAPCDGLVIDQDEIQHCGSQAATKMQEVATRMGAMQGFETEEFKNLTHSVTR